MRLHIDDLFNTINKPTALAVRLFSAGLLSSHARHQIFATERKMSNLIDAIQASIQLEPQNFYVIVNELDKDSSLKELCGKLRSTCGEYDNVCLSTSTDQCMVF